MARWTCPACDREFGRSRQSHVCIPAMGIDEYFATRPAYERAVFDAVVAHLGSVGPIFVEPVSVGVLIKRARTFAELRPKKRGVALTVKLDRRIEHPRFTRVLTYGERRVAHFVDLHGPDDVDDEVCEWLTEAYFDSKEA